MTLKDPTLCEISNELIRIENYAFKMKVSQFSTRKEAQTFIDKHAQYLFDEYMTMKNEGATDIQLNQFKMCNYGYDLASIEIINHVLNCSSEKNTNSPLNRMARDNLAEKSTEALQRFALNKISQSVGIDLSSFLD